MVCNHDVGQAAERVGGGTGSSARLQAAHTTGQDLDQSANYSLLTFSLGKRRPGRELREEG